MSALGVTLRAVRDRGGRSFVPYVTGGYPGVDAELLWSLEAAGADALEIGIPHSDPIMDGGVIQEASSTALERGTRPADVLDTVRAAGLRIPVAVMTYVNPVLRRGVEAFLDDAAAAGVVGAIVPDLPVDEAWAFEAAAVERGIDVVLLAAPGTAETRYAAIAAASRGFVYCVATYGVTGVREDLGGAAREVVGALRSLTDLPLLVGVGIGTPDQAAQACTFADGVIVGSALMAALADGGAGAVRDLAGAFRTVIPRA